MATPSRVSPAPMPAGAPLRIELEQEGDRRWIAEIGDLPGVLAYGATREEAIAKAEALALRVLADRAEHRESLPPDHAGELMFRPSTSTQAHD